MRRRVLKALGSSLALGTKIEQFTTHSAVAAPYLEERANWMETATRPASTNIQVAGLVNPHALIGIQLIAHAGQGEKESIVVPGMPASPGKPFKPAPHATAHGDFVFITGQVSFDFDEGYPAAAEIDTTSWYQSKAIAEARYIVGKIARILKHLGGSLKDCVKLEIYLNDVEDVVDLEKVVRESFGDEAPARSYIPVIRLGPTHCRVEIAAICRRPGSRQAITRLEGNDRSWLAPAAIAYGGFLFTSSLAGNMPGRLDVSLPLADQVQRLFDAVASLAPLRQSGLDNVLFASMQIAKGVDLGALRWHAEQAKGQEQDRHQPGGRQLAALDTGKHTGRFHLLASDRSIVCAKPEARIMSFVLPETTLSAAGFHESPIARMRDNHRAAHRRGPLSGGADRARPGRCIGANTEFRRSPHRRGACGVRHALAPLFAEQGAHGLRHLGSGRGG